MARRGPMDHGARAPGRPDRLAAVCAGGVPSWLPRQRAGERPRRPRSLDRRQSRVRVRGDVDDDRDAGRHGRRSPGHPAEAARPRAVPRGRAQSRRRRQRAVVRARARQRDAHVGPRLHRGQLHPRPRRARWRPGNAAPAGRQPGERVPRARRGHRPGTPPLRRRQPRRRARSQHGGLRHHRVRRRLSSRRPCRVTHVRRRPARCASTARASRCRASRRPDASGHRISGTTASSITPSRSSSTDASTPSSTAPHEGHLYRRLRHAEVAADPEVLARVRAWYTAHGMF